MKRDQSEAPADFRLSGLMRSVIEQYQDALLRVASGGQRPDVEDYLSSIPVADREKARTLLEQLGPSIKSYESDRTIGLSPDIVDPKRITTQCADTIALSTTGTGSETDPAISLSNSSAKSPSSQMKSDLTSGTVSFSNMQELEGIEVAAGSETVGFQPPAGRVGTTAMPAVDGYEILGELGRGGMGVVYKAQHIKLHRIVALKMVLAGAHVSAEQLARFFIEAESVAQLVHPNIVQIYEVGEQDGLPYFSLEYVDGGSLADKIDLQAMDARESASITATLARAMAAAHAHKVIHRDLKPANVLLTSDGIPKITDFGLAKRLESDSSQTRSGTLMGTPSYMAPEQASGDTHAIGPLADVYALGVILYECLTGRPPFTGTSIVDTLRQVQNLEPVPPSRLQPKVPADLETICLKCLQKEANKRYESALALAEDLDRFVAGQPILARPVGSVERLWRWCKRNPRVAVLTASVLALLVTVAIGSSVMAYRIAQEREAAVEARKLADEKAEDEMIARRAADQSAKEAKIAKALADANAKIASEQADLSLQTLQTLVIKVQEQLEDAPRTQQLKKELLQTAMVGLKRVADRAESANSTEATMAAAHMKMGLMFRQLGETEEAFKQFKLCHEITRKRAEAQPGWASSQMNLAATFTMLGSMSQELRRDMKAALDYYQKAMEIYETVYANPDGNGERPVKPPVVKRSLTESYTRVAVTFLRLGDPAEASAVFDKVLQLREEIAKENPGNEKAIQDLTRTYIAIAEVRFRSDDRTKAREYFEKCLTERERILMEAPNNARYKWELAAACGNYGDFNVYCGKLEPALPLYERGLALSRELAQSDPDNADLQRELGVALYRLGVLSQLTNDPKSEALLKECLRIREALAKDKKNEPRQLDLMLVLARIREHVRAASLADQFRTGHEQDAEVLFLLARCYAGCYSASQAPLQIIYEQKAIQALKDAVKAGYRDRVAIESEPDLAPIRGMADVQAIIADLKKTVSGN